MQICLSLGFGFGERGAEGWAELEAQEGFPMCVRSTWLGLVTFRTPEERRNEGVGGREASGWGSTSS